MQRRYDLDWLRVIAFAILMLFHSGMMFSRFDWHVKNLESSPLIDHFILFLHQWRMPLLFFISGGAVWFAMEKYSIRRYLGERHKRLLLPLVFGMLVVIPPQVYCERLYQRQAYSSFFDFYPTIFTSGAYPEGNLSWHHLWYVPYIWTFSMVTLPLFAWLRSPFGRVVLLRLQERLESPPALLILFLPSAFVEILLRPYFPGDSNNLFSDWANFAHKLTFFVTGFILASAPKVSDSLARHRRGFLALALAALTALVVIPKLAPIQLSGPKLNSWVVAAYRCLSNFHIWMWVLAALAFGRRYLNFNHRLLRYSTDAVYPFYILHQTVIVILALQLAAVDMHLWPKYLIVLFGTFLITLALYDLAIRRVNVLRLCFGLKPKRDGAARAGVESQPGSQTTPAPCASGVAERASKFLLAALLAMLCSPSVLASGGRVVPVTLEAPSLHGNLLGVADTQPVAVYLPPSYHSGARRYPVVYLLPNFDTPIWRYSAGAFQEFRLPETMDRLVARGAIRETILVIPNALHLLGTSWYRNSKLTGGWEDFIAYDLVRFIDGRYRTLSDARGRGLAGHGIGGTGALELGLKHPEVFCSVYAMSPAVLDDAGEREFASAWADQAPRWQSLLDRWQNLDAPARRNAFRLYTQACLTGSSHRAHFDAIRLSCLAAYSPDLSVPYPHIGLPLAGPSHDAGAEPAWSNILGGWETKAAAYLQRSSRLNSITIEFGKDDEYEWIRRGAAHVSRLLNAMAVPNTLVLSEGGHDDTLGKRLETGMLPALSRALSGD